MNGNKNIVIRIPIPEIILACKGHWKLPTAILILGLVSLGLGAFPAKKPEEIFMFLALIWTVAALATFNSFVRNPSRYVFFAVLLTFQMWAMEVAGRHIIAAIGLLPYAALLFSIAGAVFLLNLFFSLYITPSYK